MVEEEAPEEPADDPLIDIADELSRTIDAEKKKHTLLERQFTFELDQPAEDEEEEAEEAE